MPRSPQLTIRSPDRFSLCSANRPIRSPLKASDPVFKSAISVWSKLYANSSTSAKSCAWLKAMPSRTLLLRRSFPNPFRRGSRRGETCLPVQAGPRAEADIRTRLIRPDHKPRRILKSGGAFYFSLHLSWIGLSAEALGIKPRRPPPSSPALLIGFPPPHITTLPFPPLREERERKTPSCLCDLSLKQSVVENLDQPAA